MTVNLRNSNCHSDDQSQAPDDELIGTFDPEMFELFRSDDSEDRTTSKPKPASTDEQVRASLKDLIDDASNRIWIGRDPYETLAELRNRVDAIAFTTAAQAFPVVTSSQLDQANYQTDYLIEGVLAAMQPCVFAASKKSLKTTIAIDMVLSLASQSKFLGKFCVPRAVRVALISGESGDAVIQETARRIARSKPWFNLADYELALWGFTLPRLGRPQTKSELIKFVKDHSLEALVIDPAYLCLDLGGDAGNLFEVGPKLFELTEVGQETGCTIVIVHHNRKSQKESVFAPPELESIAWSGFQEWARQWILLGRREPYNPEQSGSHRLWLSVGGSAGHSGLWGVDVEEGSRSDPGGRRWDVTVESTSVIISESIDQREAAKESRAEKKLAADVAKLLGVYAKFPDGETARTLRIKAGMNPERFEFVNDMLIDSGQIEVLADGIKKAGRTYDLYLPTTGTQRNSTERTGTVPVVPVRERDTELSPYKGGVPVPHHAQTELPSELSMPSHNAQEAKTQSAMFDVDDLRLSLDDQYTPPPLWLPPERPTNGRPA